MGFDQVSLLAAIGFSGAALCVTLLGAWMGARTDLFLVNWSGGLAAIVAGVILFAMLGETYNEPLQWASFMAFLSGFGLIYGGSMQFRTGRANWRLVGFAVFAGVAPTTVAFLLGYSGIGTTVGNVMIGAILLLIAREYWTGRKEVPLAMTTGAILYVVTAISFFLCGFVLVAEERWVLTERPSNWAEDLNSIVAIIGLTGIGALSLGVNQSRIARYHHLQAQTDPLTGLLNRRGLAERYGAVTQNARSAVIVFDLDRFKAINDLYGHGVGDVVLSRFAGVMRANIRSTDIAARFGGEEFCVILQDADQRTAVAIAERIRHELAAQLFAAEGRSIAATVSAGVTVSSERGQPIDALIAVADDALYRAKTEGRNRVRSGPYPRAA